MFRSLFSNIPTVTKNIVIINILFFLATIVLEKQGIYLISILGLHYPYSSLFEPYQIVTHFFMHSGFTHIFFNMFALIVFGSMLEKVWGPKRYFIFYLVTAFGASILYYLVQGYEIYQLCGTFAPDYLSMGNEVILKNISYQGYVNISELLYRPVVGASGAIYGLIAGAALLFPNTIMQLLFPPIPIKLKWLALILVGLEIYQEVYRSPTDTVAHFAHLGGMLFGFIMIQIWKKDRQNFY